MRAERHLAYLSLATLAACTDPGDPSPPPGPWGVPITGGTMLVTRDGQQAVIADPDRDRVVAVDLARGEVVGEVSLLSGDEPGRLVEDGAGRVHVALRRGGALVTLGGAHHDAVLARRTVCAEPRGLAWQAAGDAVHVACAGGELVTLPAAGGGISRRLRLDRDLRDVLVDGDRLRVSRFRAAELLTIDAAGAIVARDRSPVVQRIGAGPVPFDTPPPELPLVDAVAAVAWRTVPLPDGRIAMLHQRQVKTVLDTSPDGYRGGCGGPVETAMSTFRTGAPAFAVRPAFLGPVAVDLAVAPAGDRIAIAVAGSREVRVESLSLLEQPDTGDECRDALPDNARVPDVAFTDRGAPTAVAFTPAGALVSFYPDEPTLLVQDAGGERIVALTGGIGVNPGRALFHRQTGSGLACASCHPEGREDGLVWDFATLGSRRTQMVAGHVLARAPYHWDGDQADLPTLMTNVFTGRMAGGELTPEEAFTLGPWLDRIPAPAPITVDAAAAARGRALFTSEEVGCAVCHGGPLLTSNLRVAVGTGTDAAAFKVPSLVGVGARAPFMHDGCAATLADRFGPCGGGDLHGHTSQLSPAQLADLVTYLESL
jgi:mono/diheme cytochrome c family protein